MEAKLVIAYVIDNWDQIYMVSMAIIGQASLIAANLRSSKGDTPASRFSSLLDLLSLSVGGAAPVEKTSLDKVDTLKDTGKLLKHIFTGK